MFSILDWAIRYVNNGISVIPVEPHGKKLGCPWKEYMDRLPTLDELNEWFGPDKDFSDGNLGIVLGSASGLWAVDADGPQAVERIDALIRRGYVPDTRMRVATPRGRHYYFSIPAGEQVLSRLAISRIDIRGHGACVVAPPSFNCRASYKWIHKFKDGYRPPEFHPEYPLKSKEDC